MKNWSSELKIRLILSVMRLFGRLPLGFHYFWGSLVAWVMKDVMQYRLDVVLTNIARSFPEMDYRTVKKSMTGSWHLTPSSL